jgi:hypothetical protein
MAQTDLAPLAYVNVGPDGTFRKSANYSSTPAEIGELFVRTDAEGKRKLVLYLHGVVPEDQGMAAVRNMHVVLSNYCYPIGFVWETGFAETIKYPIN